MLCCAVLWQWPVQRDANAATVIAPTPASAPVAVAITSVAFSQTLSN